MPQPALMRGLPNGHFQVTHIRHLSELRYENIQLYPSLSITHEVGFCQPTDVENIAPASYLNWCVMGKKKKKQNKKNRDKGMYRLKMYVSFGGATIVMLFGLAFVWLYANGHEQLNDLKDTFGAISFGGIGLLVMRFMFGGKK